MAQVHSIDGTTITHINAADWEQAVVDQSLNLISVHSRFRTHVWQSAAMPMSIWQILIGKRSALVTLVTTPEADRNNTTYATYYGVKVMDVTKRSHTARYAEGVQVTFQVRP